MIHFRTLPQIDNQDLLSIRKRLADLVHLLEGSRLLITGGTGFLGRWLVEGFLDLDSDYMLGSNLTILSRNPDAFLSLLPHLKSDKIDFIRGDIRSFSFPEKHFTHIIHGAASPDLGLNSRNPFEMYDVIVNGTKRLLEYATSKGVNRVLTLSTSNIYGSEQNYLHRVFEGCNISPDPYNKNAAYLEGKRVSEFLCATFAERTETKLPVARLFHQIGAHIPLNTGNAVGDFINNVLQSSPILLKSDGSNYRSYMYGTDFVVWIYTLLLKGECKAYNVGSENGYFLADIARKIANEYGLNVQHLIPECKVHDRKGVIPSTERAFMDFGLTTEVDLTDAIQKTVTWYRKALPNN